MLNMKSEGKPQATIDNEHAAGKLRTAFDLLELARNIMRQNICRENPDASPEEIEERLWQWINKTPGILKINCGE